MPPTSPADTCAASRSRVISKASTSSSWGREAACEFCDCAGITDTTMVNITTMRPVLTTLDRIMDLFSGTLFTLIVWLYYGGVKFSWIYLNLFDFFSIMVDKKKRITIH